MPLGHLSLYFSIRSRCPFLKLLSNLLFTSVDLCSHNILPSRCKLRMCLHGRHGLRLGVLNPLLCLLILSCKYVAWLCPLVLELCCRNKFRFFVVNVSLVFKGGSMVSYPLFVPAKARPLIFRRSTNREVESSVCLS